MLHELVVLGDFVEIERSKQKLAFRFPGQHFQPLRKADGSSHQAHPKLAEVPRFPGGIRPKPQRFAQRLFVHT
jgi:hypothetical protein